MIKKKITQEELKQFLRKHKLWLDSKADGERANLRGADLSDADLSDADLCRANLCRANLSDANLRGADLDYSTLPLWCGSLLASFDDRQLVQIAYHLVKAGLNSNNASRETKAELRKLIDFANKFHRVNECGAIEDLSDE